MFVEFAQTDEAPVMQLEIAAFTVTVFVVVEVQVPLEVVNVRVYVQVVDPALTTTDALLVAPGIVPFPVILHEYVDIPEGAL